ncbi:hypothetical protein [uncultured Paraglaciecola sp.]|uniref:hypothetical protein n=1 Tax=uncultured Paraglaciecola sp. TaxID=1765024 RepID=UPI0030DACD10|tara:strand:- start:1577 stop:2407 length:831 start_codon:yes stop_codon:yes gene_type:complete
MAALAFMQQMQSYLTVEPLLSSATVGVALPIINTDLPAIVLSLDNLQIPSVGLGQHTEIVSGALAVQTSIDLSDPLLNDGSGLSLLSPDRMMATLQHGGLVDSEGSSTALTTADIQVDINGIPLILNQNSPRDDEFSVSALQGQLVLGRPLPPLGTLTASYFIGQWQRIVEQLSGDLTTLVVSSSSAVSESLSNAVINVVSSAHQNISGLRQLNLNQLSAVNAFDMGATPASQRVLAWRFTFEHIVNKPESSGGIIQRIILRTRRDSFPFEEEDIT